MWQNPNERSTLLNSLRLVVRSRASLKQHGVGPKAGGCLSEPEPTSRSSSQNGTAHFEELSLQWVGFFLQMSFAAPLAAFFNHLSAR